MGLLNAEVLKNRVENPMYNGPDAPKPWVELSPADKVERMRVIVKHLQGQVDFLQSSIWRMETQFRQHRHVGSELMVNVNEVHIAVSTDGLDTKRFDETKVFF